MLFPDFDTVSCNIHGKEQQHSQPRVITMTKHFFSRALHSYINFKRNFLCYVRLFAFVMYSRSFSWKAGGVSSKARTGV